MAKKTIGDQIYKLRKSKGLSQEELGYEIGVSRQTVSKWEANTMQPNIENIRTLCSVFNLDLNYFVNGNISELQASELAISELTDSKKKQLSKNVLIALIAIFSIIIVVLAFLATTYALIIFSPNNGDSAVSTFTVDISIFIIIVVIIGILSFADVMFIIKLIKKIKMQSNVDKM